MAGFEPKISVSGVFYPRPQRPAEGVNISQIALSFQYDSLLTHQVLGEEDCLVVNVYVPGDAGEARSKDELLPVMFWIHGGGYYVGLGHSDLYGAERFMDYGVVSDDDT